MDVTGVSGFGPVVRDSTLYVDDLGIGFEQVWGDYRYTEQLKGARHFSLMPLERLAESLFGKQEWPEGRVVPQAWVEFLVADLAAATEELHNRGYELLVRNRTEPWGQVLTRFLAPNGLMVGLVQR